MEIETSFIKMENEICQVRCSKADNKLQAVEEKLGVSRRKELSAGLRRCQQSEESKMMLSVEILRVLAGDHPWRSGMPSQAFQAAA